MPFYSATGKLITKEDVKPERPSLKETVEYKADGSLIIEKDEKELSHPPMGLPTNSQLLNIPKKKITVKEEE